MKTATKVASVLAVVAGMSFVLASEAQAGKRGRSGSNKYYRSYFSKDYSFGKHCQRPHYGFCSHYKRYGYCSYYVPGPVGGAPALGTIPAPAPGIPAVVQPSSGVIAAVVQPVPQVVATSLPGGMVVVWAQTTAQTAQTGTAASTTTTATTTSPSIDEAQLTAIVAAVQSAMEQPKQAEQPKIDPAILKALEQLIDQKMAEAAKATETETAEATETEATSLHENEHAESESNDSTLESLSAMIAQMLAQE